MSRPASAAAAAAVVAAPTALAATATAAAPAAAAAAAAATTASATASATATTTTAAATASPRRLAAAFVAPAAVAAARGGVGHGSTFVPPAAAVVAKAARRSGRRSTVAGVGGRRRAATPAVMVAGAATAGGGPREPLPLPTNGLLPKDATGVSEYLAAHANHDGRGVTVAVLDTGVDPGAAGLRRTSDGRVKVVDIIDCTASGDVPLSGRGVVSADGRSLTGITGRTLQLTNEMRALAARGAAPTADGTAVHHAAGEWRLGVASAARLFPSGLASRISAERRVAWEAIHRDKLADIRRRKAAHAAVTPPTGGGASAKAYKLLKEELAAAEALLVQANAPTSAAVYDVVAFWDGTRWRVVVDTSEAGDLSACPVLEDYRVAQRYGSFGDRERVHFGVNVYDDGTVVSVVVESGYHGTHVAGIVAGHYPDAPERNGVAPGAQIVSLKIGDSRIDGMETHQGLVRALAHLLPASLEDPSVPPHAAQHKVVAQVANMSYGEATPLPNTGRVVQLLTVLAREAGVLFLSSAGNAGPGLSTVGAPGGTTDAVIGVGAYVTPGLATQAYSLLPDGLVYPSPGALCADGYPPAPEGLSAGLTGGGVAGPTSGVRVKSERADVIAPTAAVVASASSTAPAAEEEDGDELPLGVPYTFTSRGPCADGSLGVCISAPGGAVAASSSWMLRKKLLLNGTSMSCPSAAGAAALVLSARPSTSVARLRRAIENGAATGLRPAFFGTAAGPPSSSPKELSLSMAAARIDNGAGVGNGTERVVKAPVASATRASSITGGTRDSALTASEMAFSAGFGSISVPRTIAYLDAYAQCVEEDWRFAVSVTDSSQRAIIRARGSSREYGRGRGVYLRAGGHECRSVSKWLVHLDVADDALPDRSAAAAEMASDLELDISLIPSAPWISAPAGVRLYGGGRQFPISVDPTGLTPGRMHYGEVAGYLAPSAGAVRPHVTGNIQDWAEPRGPLFRVPVTVVKPLLLAGGDGGVGSLVVENLPLTPGGVVRTFVLPPAAATFARVALTAGTADEFLGSAGVASADGVIAARTVQLHAVQLVPGSAPGGPRHVFTLSPDGVGSVVIPVNGGITMELALAQLWSSAGACTVRRLEVTFSGLSVSPSMLSVGAGAVASPCVLLTNQLPQGGSSRRLTLDASDETAYAAAAEAAERGTAGLSLASETPPVLAGVGVKASITHATRVLPPALAVITALPRDRDLLPDARCIYQLELEYTLSLSTSESNGANSGVDVSVLFPGLNLAVYNAEVEGGPYVMVYDSNGKLVHTSDIYPSFASLSVKGTYTIRAFVRHEQVGLLETLTEMCATISMKLASAISLEPYGSAHAAALAAGDGGVGGKLAISSSGRATLAPGAALAFWLAQPKKGSLPKWVATGDNLVGNLVVDRVLAPDGAVRSGTTFTGLAQYGLTWAVSPTMSGEKSPKAERAPSGPAVAKSAATTKAGEVSEKVTGQTTSTDTATDSAAAVDKPSTPNAAAATDAPEVAAVADVKDTGKDKDVASWVASQLSDARVGVMKKLVKEANGANLSDAPTHLARFTALADAHLAEKANDSAVLLMRLQLVDSVAQRRVAAAAAAALGVLSPDAVVLAPIAGGEGDEGGARANSVVPPPSSGTVVGSDAPDWAAVIAAADGVVDAIDVAALAAHFGTRVNADDESAVAERKRQDTTRSTLIEALFRKARAAAAVATAAMVAACGSTVGPPLLSDGGDAASTDGAAADVAAFEEAFIALAAWADVSAPAPGSAPASSPPAVSGGVPGVKAHASVSGATVVDVALLVSARERLRGCPATALRALAGLASPAVGGRALAAATVERFALLAALGWTDAEADARAAAAVAFPKFWERY
ncbi:hypothetical protein MMPV_000237 [Pyropia vietnamensis]